MDANTDPHSFAAFASHRWAQLNTRDFAALDPARTVAVLPLGATEQHGPHLPLSVDTAKPEVMRVVLDMGVDIIIDIWALRQAGALDVVSQHAGCGVCLMHMHRDPQTMFEQPMKGDALLEVKDFLFQRLQVLLEEGVDPSRIVLDPGVGFGKTLDQNLSLLTRQAELLSLGRPLLAGWSRKGTLGKLTAVHGVVPEPQNRVGASVGAALMAVQNGASLVRVHDVLETVQALRFWQATKA